MIKNEIGLDFTQNTSKFSILPSKWHLIASKYPKLAVPCGQNPSRLIMSFFTKVTISCKALFLKTISYNLFYTFTGDNCAGILEYTTQLCYLATITSTSTEALTA